MSIKSTEPKLGRYAVWKLVSLTFLILYIFSSEITFADKLPYFIVLSQLFALEDLITSRLDSIIQ
tara:strand:- start:2953 stop:3147 length:195 start_codon:yes stop_codon:yes gene_type:complete